MTKAVTAAKVPLVYFNRKPDNLPRAASTAGRTPSRRACSLGEEVGKALGGKGNVAILMGELPPRPPSERTEGTEGRHDAKYPGMKIVRKQTATGSADAVKTMVENWLATGDKIDAIIANNDEMAIGAVLAMEEKKLKVKVGVTGGTRPDALNSWTRAAGHDRVPERRRRRVRARCRRP